MLPACSQLGSFQRGEGTELVIAIGLRATSEEAEGQNAANVKGPGKGRVGSAL